ncbi:MAG: RNA polymerase sigma factor [Planctomycetota bacterium]
MTAPPNNRDSDEDLMRRTAAGDVAAFEAIFDRYAGRIVSFALRMTGDRDLAESLAQETFLRALKNASGYAYPRPFSPWLFAIARNACLDELRRKKPVLLDTPSPIEDPGGAPSLLSALVQDEEAKALMTAIQDLPDKFREVLVLRAFHDLPYAEIAEIVNCNESTARSRMDYALGRLRKFFHTKNL